MRKPFTPDNIHDITVHSDAGDYQFRIQAASDGKRMQVWIPRVFGYATDDLKYYESLFRACARQLKLDIAHLDNIDREKNDIPDQLELPF